MLKQRRAILNGVHYAYLDGGAGLPLVMLHGWPEHSACWRKMASFLVDKFRVIAPDFRGCGDTEVTTSGFDKKTLANEVAALLDHLGIERAILVGHDWGTPVAYRVALDFPARVAGLIVLNGRMPLLASHTELMYTPQQVRERWYFFFHLVPELPEVVIGRSLPEYFSCLIEHWAGSKPSHDAEAIAELVRCNGRPGGLRAGLGFYRTAVAEDVADWKEHAGRVISVPNLVLWGARDPVLPPIYVEGLETVTPDLELHINRLSGHFIQEEEPEWCAEHTRNFLERRFAGAA
jgi:pimeloyl-ACP methyl ester carboxylesterase